MIKNMEKTYLCFDLGTTKIKSSLLDNNGNIICLSSRTAKSYHDGESVIQKPEEYFSAVASEIKKIAKKHPLHFKKVVSLICSGQMAGILGIDSNWEVVFPWTYSVDTRASSYLAKIENTMDYRAIWKSSGGLPYMAAKIQWIEDCFPKEYKKIYKFINLTTYVAGKLCGLAGDDAFIDYSVLSMSGLADIKKGKWNSEICDRLKIDMARLPSIKRPYCSIGSIDKSKYKTEKDIKVLAGIGDQIAGFIGAGAVNSNDLIDVAGTYTVLGCCMDEFVTDHEDKMLSTIFSGIDGIYYQLAVVAVGGYLHNWFKEKFSYDDKKEFKKDIDTDGLYFIPHIGGRLAPSQPYYQGTWFGIKWHHDLDSFYISLLESIGYVFYHILSHLRKINNLDRDKASDIKVIGGGSKNTAWNNIKSNILNLKYLIMEEIPFEVIGSFMIAKFGSDLREGYRQLNGNKIISINKEVCPQKDRVDFYKKHKDKYIRVVDKIGKI